MCAASSRKSSISTHALPYRRTAPVMASTKVESTADQRISGVPELSAATPPARTSQTAATAAIIHKMSGIIRRQGKGWDTNVVLNLDKGMNKLSKLTKRGVLSALFASVVIVAAFTPASPRMVLVIDAGHGGKDPGNLGTGRYKQTEKDVTLDVSLKLREYVEERLPGVEVVMTRTGDNYPSLQDRVRISNEVQADLFISVHCDAFDKPAAVGSSTFVMGMHKSEESLRVAMQENAAIFQEEDYEKRYEGFDPRDPDTYIALALRQNVFLGKSLELGKSIQDQFRDRIGRKDRGVKQAGYYVISFTNMPSVLVELGFLTNPGEEDFLQSEQGKDYMASALFRAVRDYTDKHHPLGPPEALADAPTEVTEHPDAEAPIAAQAPSTDVFFRVQVCASSSPIPQDDPRFGGQPVVVEYIRNGLYKYAVGAAATRAEAEALMRTMRQGAFPDAFVVRFKGNDPWPE
jgi:N-acetylmuramoyl-L-alanine amidase